MRSSTWALFATILLLVSVAVAEQKTKTDAQEYGFSGPIKSVLTNIVRHDIAWRPPNGPWLTLEPSCRSCDYDPSGAAVKMEEQSISILRGAEGNISERSSLDPSGALMTHEIFGPFGVTERDNYHLGEMISSSTFRYDLSGHVTETVFLDSTGGQVGRMHNTYDKDGVFTEGSSWDKSDRLEWQHLFDPHTQTESFTTFDEVGNVELALKRKDSKMVSFWERSDKENQYGDCMTDDETEDGTEDTHCFANGNRERAFIRYRYTKSKDTQMVKSSEWRDGAGTLLYAAYFHYELDGQGNWTRRFVSVTSPELPENTLLEEDTRVIVYW